MSLVAHEGVRRKLPKDDKLYEEVVLDKYLTGADSSAVPLAVSADAGSFGRIRILRRHAQHREAHDDVTGLKFGHQVAEARENEIVRVRQKGV